MSQQPPSPRQPGPITEARMAQLPWPPRPEPQNQPGLRTPAGSPPGPAPRRKGARLWVLAGAGLLALLLIAGVAWGVAGSSGSKNAHSSATAGASNSESAEPFGSGGPLAFGSRGKAAMIDSTTAMASFQYPKGWMQTGRNVLTVSGDGTVPAEKFVARNGALGGTALLSYTATAAPANPPTRQLIRQVMDQGFQGQLDAPQDQLLHMRSTSGFGCIKDFNFTQQPGMIERDHMYGFSYGYRCMTLYGSVEGEHLVVSDDTGVVHRLTVEALQFEWDGSPESLTAIIDSFKPKL